MDSKVWYLDALNIRTNLMKFEIPLPILQLNIFSTWVHSTFPLILKSKSYDEPYQ